MDRRKFIWIWSDPAVCSYAVLAAACSFFIIQMLSERFSLLPIPLLLVMMLSVGVSLAARLSIGPAAMIVLIALMEFRPLHGRLGIFPRQQLSGLVADFALVSAVLGYMLAHFRFLEMSRQREDDYHEERVTNSSHPPELSSPAQQSGLRSAGEPKLVSKALMFECVRLLLSLPLFVFAAAVVWNALPTSALWAWRLVPVEHSAYPMLVLDPAGRLLAALWVMGGAAIIVTVVLGYLARRRADPLLAELLLNEIVWPEIRREANHVSSRVARAEKRRRQKRRRGPFIQNGE